MTTRAYRAATVPIPINAYSQAVGTDAFVFLSGQLAYDPATDSVPDIPAGEQAARVMENLAAVLAAAGLGFEHVVKSTIYLIDPADFMSVNTAYAAALGEVMPPARTTLGVAFLAKGAKVEIEMVACRPGPGPVS